MSTVIHWHTRTIPDQAGMNMILSALRSNRRMRHASFQIAEPDEIDGEGAVTITGNRLDRMICPADVRHLIEECLS